MHSTLTIAAAHERYLTRSPVGHRSLHEIFHWSQCVALLNQKLSHQPIRLEDKDPIWAAAASFSVISFSSADALKPEDAWPLKRPEPSDLVWLRLSEGKKVIWDLVQPLRSGSVFYSMSVEYAKLFPPISPVRSDNISPQLERVCNLDPSSTLENNPYFGAAHALSRLEGHPREDLTPSQCFIFTRHMERPFKKLLDKKDPIALLLMALWYRTSGPVVWWIEQRATVERQAICLYIQRHHGNASDILDLLPWENSAEA
jgi:hypothetical protein